MSTIYPDGAEVGNMNVVRTVRSGPKLKDMAYLVRYVCCSREEVLPHYTLAKRGGKRNSACKVCVHGVKAGAEQPAITVWIFDGPMRGPWTSLGKMGRRASC